MNLKKNLFPFLLLYLLVFIDLFIKYLVRTNNIQEKVIVDNILTIDLTYNTGIAFGLFSQYTLLTYVFSILVLFWLIYQLNKIQKNTFEFYSLLLILSGALGNLSERGWNLVNDNDGKVTDFIELLFIPSFNFADVYISIGIFFLILSELKKN